MLKHWKNPHLVQMVIHSKYICLSVCIASATVELRVQKKIRVFFSCIGKENITDTITTALPSTPKCRNQCWLLWLSIIQSKYFFAGMFRFNSTSAKDILRFYGDGIYYSCWCYCRCYSFPPRKFVCFFLLPNRTPFQALRNSSVFLMCACDCMSELFKNL